MIDTREYYIKNGSQEIKTVYENIAVISMNN